MYIARCYFSIDIFWNNSATRLLATSALGYFLPDSLEVGSRTILVMMGSAVRPHVYFMDNFIFY